MNVRLSEKEVEWLLRYLCVKLGFCLLFTVNQQLVNNPPTNEEQFVGAVYKAEGLDPELKSPLYQQVHVMVAKVFQRHKDNHKG